MDEFVDQLSAAIEAQAIARARVSVDAALAGQPVGRGNGRLRAAVVGIAASSFGARPRKKPPIQLCPVPGCKERAAPIFGMVCAAHKDVPKTKIRKYREDRRAGKVSARGSGARAGKGSARKKAARPLAKAKPARASGGVKSPKNGKTSKPAQTAKAAKATKATRAAKAKSSSSQVEVVQTPAKVRAGAAATSMKPKRPSPPREAAPAVSTAPPPAAPAQA